MNELLNMITKDFNTLFDNNLVVILLLVFLGIATYTDIKSLKIYNKFNLVFLITRIILIFIPTYGLKLGINNIGGALFGFLILFIPAMVKMHKMAGDIKFITVFGLYLGFPLTIVLMSLSCISMLIFSFIRKIVTKKEIGKVLTPFAPFFTFSFITMLMIYILL